MKTKLTLRNGNEIELSDERILCNCVSIPVERTNVRCYDNGGESFDRYTVVFGGRYRKVRRAFYYLGMSANPFDPQGFGQHGESDGRPVDANSSGFVPAMGRSCHLGKRVPFESLPTDCRKLAESAYREIWKA